MFLIVQYVDQSQLFKAHQFAIQGSEKMKHIIISVKLKKPKNVHIPQTSYVF